MAEERALPSLYPPAKKVKSEVWKYFGYRKNAQGSIVEDGFPICKECGKEVAAKRGNTSNMFTHLRHNHLLEFSEVLVSYNCSFSQTFSLQTAGFYLVITYFNLVLGVHVFCVKAGAAIFPIILVVYITGSVIYTCQGPIAN